MKMLWLKCLHLTIGRKGEKSIAGTFCILIAHFRILNPGFFPPDVFPPQVTSSGDTNEKQSPPSGSHFPTLAEYARMILNSSTQSNTGSGSPIPSSPVPGSPVPGSPVPGSPTLPPNPNTPMPNPSTPNPADVPMPDAPSPSVPMPDVPMPDVSVPGTSGTSLGPSDYDLILIDLERAIEKGKELGLPLMENQNGKRCWMNT